jgi:hypothetical protein
MLALDEEPRSQTTLALDDEEQQALRARSRVDLSRRDTAGVVSETDTDVRSSTIAPALRVLKAHGRKLTIHRGANFVATARWEGVVTERFATYFVAQLIDLDNDEEATAEFDLNELSEPDIPLCEPGAFFYWAVGYEVRRSGQRVRAAPIQFRRRGSDQLANE